MRICVFCGSRVGDDPRFAQAAVETGRALAARGIELVYGGGRVGMMGEVADAVLAAGGRATGVIPRRLARREVAHEGLTELIVVETMHERKATMGRLSDAFLALPGGFGTLEEFCEVVTWTQLGIHAKPSGLLNVAGYFDPLLAMFDRSVEHGFVSPETRAIVLSADGVAEILDLLTAALPAAEPVTSGPDAPLLT